MILSKRNLRGQLNNISIKEKDGSITNLGEKFGNKKEIRHKIIRLRKEMDPLVWQQTTNTITETVINHPLFLEATDIYCYANYNGETGTLAIMEEAWKLGKSVWFPRVEGSEMNFYLVEQKRGSAAWCIWNSGTDR